MTDELDRLLTDRVDAATPDTLPPYAEVVAQRGRRRSRRRVAGVVAAVVVVAAVGSAVALANRPSDERGSDVVTQPTQPTASTSPTVRPDEPPEWNHEGPPPVFLDLGPREVKLLPWTSCYVTDSGGACADGMPLPPFEDVGDRDEVHFRFPIAGWRFQASFEPLGHACGQRSSARVRTDGRYSFTVLPPDTPGSYRVDVFGRGDGGDAVVSFAWRSGDPC